MILPSEHSDGLEQASAKFSPGELYVTPAALAVLAQDDLVTCLTRHIAGDWGDVDEDDRAENEFALHEKGRLFSVYRAINGTKFWIITEWDRKTTTILLPSDY